MKNKRFFIYIQGIVQGVGFRPYIYNLALSYKLKGWVNNTSEGVYIEIEGDEQSTASFINDVPQKAPPLSQIESITVEEKPLHNYTDFDINRSA